MCCNSSRGIVRAADDATLKEVVRKTLKTFNLKLLFLQGATPTMSSSTSHDGSDADSLIENG
jgi:hypothetical protein